MLKAIFFDFNGVIIDDETIQMQAYREVLRGHDIELTEEWYFDALGMDDRTFVRAMFERAKKPLTDDVWQAVLEAKTVEHRKMIEDELPLFPGVLTFRFERWWKMPGLKRLTHFPAAAAGFVVTLIACARAQRHFQRGQMHYWPKASRENIQRLDLGESTLRQPQPAKN